MYFPSNEAYPSDLPAWLIAGHAFDSVGIAEETPMERGEDLARQLYTWAPTLVSVATFLEQSQFDRFSEWFERDLRAGTRRFDVRVAAQGGEGLAWWTAQFVAPYRWEAVLMPREAQTLENRYRVSAQLLLLDGPHATRISPSLRGIGRVETTLLARAPAAFTLRGLARTVTELRAVSIVEASSFITEDGDDLLAESGDTLETEA